MQFSLAEEFKYILEFAEVAEFYFEVCRQQLRCLWTAYCIHSNYDCDTGAYDSDLTQIWQALAERDDIFNDDSNPWHNINFEEFDMFMGELLS